METVTYISLIISYSIFILLGYRFSKRFENPVSVTILTIIILATFLAGWIKIVRIIDIDNFIIQFNWCLQGFGIGLIVGLFKNKYKMKSVTTLT